MTKRRYLKCFYNLLCRFANLQIRHCIQVPSHWPVAEQTQTPQTGDNQLRFARCSVGQCGHFEPGISSFTLWLWPLLSTTSTDCPSAMSTLYSLHSTDTLLYTSIHLYIRLQHLTMVLTSTTTTATTTSRKLWPQFRDWKVQYLLFARLFSYRNCGIHTQYTYKLYVASNNSSIFGDGTWWWCLSHFPIEKMLWCMSCHAGGTCFYCILDCQCLLVTRSQITLYKDWIWDLGSNDNGSTGSILIAPLALCLKARSWAINYTLHWTQLIWIEV